MIGLALALALAATPQPLQRVKAPLRPCPNPPLMKTADTAKAGFQRLGELADANMEVAVNRVQGGCPAPMIVRYDVSREDTSGPRALADRIESTGSDQNGL